MKESPSYNNRDNKFTFITRSISPQEEHLVEDARTLPQRQERIKRKRHPKGVRKALIAVMLIIFCFCATLFAADMISDGNGISEYASLFTKNKTIDRTCYYAVYASRTKDMGIAYKNASALRAEGGAGYVLKEGDEYYVILNVYPSEEDAKEVAKRDVNYAIYSIKIRPIDFGKYPSLSFAESSKNLFHESYLVLYNAANNLASGKYGESDMRRALAPQREKILANESSYSENIRGKEDNVTIEYKVLLAELRSAFDNLTTESNTLVAEARYYSVMILKSYSLFGEKFF